MDAYFAEELSVYSGGMPYCSLIFQRDEGGRFSFTGRLRDGEAWLPVREMLTVGYPLLREVAEDYRREDLPEVDDPNAGRESVTARIASLAGAQAQRRLADATVGVIGCSGTGSPAIHVLARAGVGNFVLADPERLSPSNLERLHGSSFEDVSTPKPPFKVDVMRRMIEEINPRAVVTTLRANALADAVLDELLRCDLLLGCVDTQHARVLLSDLAKHYLLPIVDAGVLMEGADGTISTQLVELTQYAPYLPCAFCGSRIDAEKLATELMNQEERACHTVAVDRARAQGEDGRQYWSGQAQQLHTVGYLTTMLGSLAAGYAEGWLTGAFEMPHPSVQFDIGQPRFGFVAMPRTRRPQCPCDQHRGWADQARPFRNIARPIDWPQ